MISERIALRIKYDLLFAVESADNATVLGYAHGAAIREKLSQAVQLRGQKNHLVLAVGRHFSSKSES